MKKWLAVISVGVLLVGCGTKTHIVEPYVFDKNLKLDLELKKEDGVNIPDEILATMKQQIRDGLAKNNLLASSTTNANHAEVTIFAYRMRPNAARLLAGAMAGCDNINSQVVVKDTSNQKIIGHSTVQMRVCNAWGVSSQVISSFSEGVVNYLSGK